MNTTYNLWVNSTARADKTFEVFIRITQNRKHKSIKTGITLSSISDFNPKAKSGKWIRGLTKDVKKLNTQLEDKITGLKDRAHDLESKNELPSKERIIQVSKGGASPDYLAYLRLLIDRMKLVGKYRSSKRYGQLLNKLEAFSKGKDLPFDIISVSFLKDFQVSMKHLHQNTVYEHFKNFKASFNEAITEDVIGADKSPFNKFKVSQVDTHKESLSEIEIIRLKGLELEYGSPQWHAWNCFLFAFYCGGIRAGDLITMKWNNIEDDSLSYVMSKTRNGKLIRKSVPLIPEAQKILHYYESPLNESNDFIFGMLDRSLSKLIGNDKKIKSGFEVKIFNQIASRNTILNKNLKKLALLSEITKPLTFHIARHSFAQYSIDRDMNPKILQSILGHEKFATTEAYISTLKNKKVEEAMLKVFQA